MIKKDEKIRLIVIGDSISSGFNSRFGYDMPGSGSTLSNEKNFIRYGLSYGSFFCNYISKIDKNKVEWYENFAIQGSRIQEWEYFYSNDKNKYEGSKLYLETMVLLDSKNDKLNFFKDRLKILYNNFDPKKNNNFDFLLKKTKEANLMFLTIGGNDTFIEMPTFDIIYDLSNNNEENIIKIFEEIYLNVYNKIFNLIKIILNINPTINIVISSYPLPFNLIQESFNFFLKKKFKLNFDFYDIVIKKSIRFLSKLALDFENVSFIDIYDQIFWKNNRLCLTSYFYEIHPSTKGYKKMAKNIFFKIVYGNEIKFQEANKIISSFEENTYNYNLPFYKKVIELDASKNEITNKLEWDKSLNEEDIFLDNNIEKFFSTFKGPYFSTNYFLVARNILEKNFIDIVKRSLLYINIDFPEYEQIIRNQFFDYENIYSLFHIVIDGNFFDDLINEGIDYIFVNYSFEIKNILYDKVIIFILRKILFEFLVDSKWYQIFKYLNNKGFFKENIDNAKSISNLFVKTIFNESFFDKFISNHIYLKINKILSQHFIYLTDFVKEEQPKKIFLFWANNSKASALMENFLFTIFVNFNYLNKYKSFSLFLEEQIDYYFDNNIIDLAQLIRNFFLNEENNTIFVIFLVDKLKIWNLNSEQFLKLKKIVVSSIEILLNSWSNSKDNIKNILNIIKLLVKYILYPNNKFSYNAWWKVLNNLMKYFLTNIYNNKEYLEKNKFIENFSWLINLLFDHLDGNSVFFNFILNRNKIKDVFNKFNINLFAFNRNKKLISDFYNIILQIYSSLFKKYDIEKLEDDWVKNNSQSYHAIFRVSIAIYFLIINLVNNTKMASSIKRKVIETTINNLSKFLYVNLSSYKELISEFYLKKIKISEIINFDSLPNILINMLFFIDKSNSIFKLDITNKELILIWLKLGYLEKKIINKK